MYIHALFFSLSFLSVWFRAIKQGKIHKGVALFESESLQWPGFVEFDDVNKKILTFSAVERVYKVWDMEFYKLLFKIEDKTIEEIKIR